MPINAAPHAAPTIAASEIGVSITRSLPKRSINPSVTLKAPPYAPTSSPIKNTVGSRSISSQIPARIASTIVAAPPRGGRSSLRSFLSAVDMVVLSVAVRNFHRRLVGRQGQPVHYITLNGLQLAVIFAAGIDERPI